MSEGKIFNRFGFSCQVRKEKKHEVPKKLAPKNLKNAKWVYENGIMTNLNAEHNAKEWVKFIANGFKNTK